MPEYDRVDVSEGIDINKTHESKECKICHYWYFTMVYCKKLLVLIILLFFMLKKVLTEFIFGI